MFLLPTRTYPHVLMNNTLSPTEFASCFFSILTLPRSSSCLVASVHVQAATQKSAEYKWITPDTTVPMMTSMEAECELVPTKLRRPDEHRVAADTVLPQGKGTLIESCLKEWVRAIEYRSSDGFRPPSTIASICPKGLVIVKLLGD